MTTPTQVPNLLATASEPYAKLWQEASAYWTDAWQRSLLTLDVLRQRGNLYLEHSQAGKPPVLVFDYDMVLDARDFERPANYALVRIHPKEGWVTDPAKRPIVVIDPRAGHGPGIGGSKIDSEIGLALRSGHPCYFVMFFPEPVTGQTVECVSRAEIQFMEKVLELHPQAEGLPLVIGNCQGGWATMLLAALAPKSVGPILLAGSPVSYWAGVEGKHPMRYNGGLSGGTWPASFLGDLGNGHFDGAWLVHNFEQLDPANTLWGKPYGLYSKIDTEAERFLTFERWWGGHFLLNREEIDWIVQNLFVGNQLTAGEIKTDDGQRVDLRNIHSPIIVFASWGDNITPPQQALNWIPDLYADVEDIRAHGQVIVYCLHDHIGHLGIFVSAGVANREHAEIVSAIDLIDTLPPGLYEAKIEDSHPEMTNVEMAGRFLIRFEPRQIEDILELGDGREHEQAFATVKRVSEINQKLYDSFVSPYIKASSNEMTAHLSRALHPSRVERYAISDNNPWLWPIPLLAEQAREKRQAADPDNRFVQLEKQWSKRIEGALDQYRDHRDALTEQSFKAIFGSPWLATLLGARENGKGDAKTRVASLRKQLERLDIKGAIKNFDQGSELDAFVRVMAYIAEDHAVDERAFNTLRQLMQAGHFKGATLADFREAVQRQSVVLMLDEDRALKGLPKLLPDMAPRKEIMSIALRLFTAAGPLRVGEQIIHRYQKICNILDVSPTTAAQVTTSSPTQATPPIIEAAATPAKPAVKKAAPPRKRKTDTV